MRGIDRHQGKPDLTGKLDLTGQTDESFRSNRSRDGRGTPATLFSSNKDIKWGEAKASRFSSLVIEEQTREAAGNNMFNQLNLLVSSHLKTIPEESLRIVIDTVERES